MEQAATHDTITTFSMVELLPESTGILSLPYQPKQCFTCIYRRQVGLILDAIAVSLNNPQFS